MRGLAVALALGLAAEATAQEAPAAVGRITYGAAHRPGAALCTGTLVAPDLVLTAAHCLRRAARAPATILFSAGVRDGVALAEARGRIVHLATGTGLAADAALVRLARPLPAAITPLPLAGADASPLTRYAYRRDLPDRPERDDTCRVLATDGPILSLSCPAESGQSGAPLLSHDGRGWQVQSVMVAKSVTGAGSFAVRVPPLLAAIIAAAVD